MRYCPRVVAVTSTWTRQLESASIVAPVSPTCPPPAVAVTVPPEQFVVALAGVATVTPAGRESVKVMPVRRGDGPLALRVLKTLMVRRLVWPEEIVVGKKLLEAPRPCRVVKLADVDKPLV